MKNILNINELLHLDSNLSPLKRNIVTPMIAFIIGIAAIFFGTHIDVSDYISYSLAVAGLILAIIALSLIFSRPDEIINIHTQEILHKHKLYFNDKDEKEIVKSLKEGDIKSLFKKTCDTGQILAIIYSTTNKRYYIAQIFKFIPYEYRPYQDPIIFKV